MSSDFVFNKEYPLSDLVEFVNEKIDSTKISLDTYISTDNMITDRGGVETATKLPSATKFHHFKPTDTLFSNIRTYFRKVWFAEFEGGASPDVLVFRTKDPKVLEPAYLFYLLSDKKFSEYTVLTSKGAKMPRGDKAAIMQYKVFVPEPNVQRAVSGALRTYDLKLKINTKINQTLEHLAQAIFKSWFVDFDPVKAKIETLATGGSADDAELAAMRVISAKTLDELNGLKASNSEAFNKLAQTAALFPAAMQDSELGEIPEGWEVEQLGDHLNVLQTGSRPKGGVGGITEGVPSVGAENILGVGNYTYGKEKFVSREFFDKLKRGVVEDFDFLLYKDGGKPGEFKPRVSMFGCGFPYSEFAINEHVFRMRSESLGQAFLYFQIGHKRVLGELANRGGKAAIPGINQTDVKTIPVLVPSAADLLTEFNEFAQKIIESILKKSNESNHLVSVRDTLLPKLLSGEIDLTSEAVA